MALFMITTLVENTEKYIIFSVPIKKKIENKDLEITYKIKFTAERTAGPTAEPSALARSSLERKNEKLILECYNCKQRYKKN